MTSPQTPSQSPVNGSPSTPAEPLVVSPPSSPQPPPGGATASSQALPQVEEAWRRERRTAQPSCRARQPALEPAPKQPPPSPTALRVEYRIRVSGGSELVTEIDSEFELPLGLQTECIAATDASFGEVLNRILFEPLQIRVRGYLQSKYENANPTGSPRNGSDHHDPGGAEEFVQQESGQTCSSGSDSWPESLDEVAKLAGFPDGLGTKRKQKG